MDREFTLAVGQSQVVDGRARLTLVDVPGDSRCPRQAVCVYAGNVQVSLRVEAGGRDTTGVVNSLELPQVMTVAGIQARVTDVQPIPDAGAPIPKYAYRVTLRVGRAP
jgi:hypothetical protein